MEEEVKNIKSKMLLVFFAILIVSMVSFQPVFAKKPITANEYVIAFEAQGGGTFLVSSGIIGSGEPDLVAVGEGTCTINGEATVTQESGGIYYDFPAVNMNMECELTGWISSAEINNDNVEISDEKWSIEFELWNKRKAGGTFDPVTDLVIVIEEMNDPSSSCLQYELALENEDGEGGELSVKDKAYAVGAGDVFPGPSPIDEIIIILEFGGEPYTIIFIDGYAEIPELEQTLIEYINVEPVED